ncbi:MAG: SDR family oxidoreductase [Chromatiales bacterium]|nr:SDR family oxidoreductase [Chromatiales bacterium]
MSESVSRNVIVTGAARGIGKAIAVALLQDNHRVTIVDVNEAVLSECRESLGQNDAVAYVHGSVTSDDDCERAVAHAISSFGTLHGLVNNAGIGVGSIRHDAEVNTPSIEELSPEIWQRFFDINVLGAIRMTRASISHLKAAKWGRIINNTTSYLTHHRVQPYGGVKAALESASAVWAKELEGTGVTVNVVVPGGPTDTEFVVEIGIARENMLRPEVMAPPLRWLFSAASDGINGRRFGAGHWDTSLAPSVAAANIARPIAWPELTGDVIWVK